MTANHKWSIVEGDGPTPRAPRSDYAALWADLMLRLERTPAHKWLHISCKDAKEAKNLALGLRKRAYSLPPGTIQVVQDTEACKVSVARGPNWAKRDAGELAHVPAHSLDAPSANGSGRKPSGRPPGRPRKTKDQTPD